MFSKTESNSGITSAKVFDQALIQEEEARQEKLRQAKANFIYMKRFSVAEGEVKVIHFFNHEPLKFHAHEQLRDPTSKYDYPIQVPCLQQDCPLCAAGFKTRFVGAYLLLELTHVNKETGSIVPTLQMWVQGKRTMGMLDLKNQSKTKGHIASEYEDGKVRMFEVTRTGKGTSTSYNFEDIEPQELPNFDTSFLDKIKNSNGDLPTPKEVLAEVLFRPKEMLEMLASANKKHSKEGASYSTNVNS